jgi:hypothetical protein
MMRRIRKPLNGAFLLGGIVALVIPAPASAAGEVAPGFTLDGTLYSSPTGTHVLNDTAVIRVQIFNPAKDCLLYDERQTVNTTTSEGAFNIQVGSALGSSHRVSGSDPGLSMTMVFQNSAPLVGAAGCTYSPLNGDVRYVRVAVTPTSTGLTDVLSPDITLGTTPSALVAERAENLQGVGKSGFLQLGAEALTQGNVASIFTNANFAALTSLLAGGGSSNAGSASGNYVIDAGTGGAGDINFNTQGSTKAVIASNGNFSVDATSFFVDAVSNRVGIGTSAPAASLDLSSRTDAVALPKGTTAQAPSAGALPGMIRFNTDKLVVEFYNGTAWVDPATGTISSIVGTGGVSATTLAGTTTVQLEDTIGSTVSAGSATTVPAITVDRKGRITSITPTTISGVTPSGAAGGDLGGTYPNPSVQALQGTAVAATAPASGQFLKFDGTSWVGKGIYRTDLKSSISAGDFFTGPSCTSAQSMYWDSGTDTVHCQNISIDAAAVGSGTLDIARIPANAKLWANDGAGKISYSGGNVGIGTASPGHALDVTGDINTQGWFRANSVSVLRSISNVTTLRSTGSMNFLVGSGGAVTAATFDAAGNLGIGTTAPSALLDVSGNQKVSGLLTVQNGNGTGSLKLGADVNATTLTANVRKLGRIVVPTYDNAGPNVLAFSGDNDGADNNVFYGGYPGSSTVTAATRLRFLTGPTITTLGGTERMTIDGNGLVGIGSTSPKAGLDVNTTGAGSAIIVPRDTVANRPAGAAAVNGMIRYATDTNVLEAYVNGAWVSIGTLGGTQSFAGNVNVGGSFTSTGAATLNGGATIAGGALAMSSQNITGVGANITGSGALAVAAGGTNQNLSLSSTGTGSVNVGSNNGTSLSVLDGGAATVNYVTVKGAATGAAPAISAAGADTNINLTISAKGTGNTIIGGTTTTTAGAFVHNGSATNKYFGIYDSANNRIYGISAQLPAPAGTSTLGGYYAGLGIGGSSNNTGAAIFGVLTSAQSGNGLGSTAFTIYDSNKVVTRNITLDDGSGKMGIGSATPAVALDVAGSARVGLSPATLTTASAATAAATTLTVASTTGYPTNGQLYIPSTGELIGYTGVSATTFNNLTRGQHGTTATAIAASAVVDVPLLNVAKTTSTTPRFISTAGSGSAFNTVPPSWLGDGGLYVSGTFYANGGVIAGNRYNYGTSSVSMWGNATSSNADYWNVTTNSLERLRIDGNGNIGIGTSVPTAGAILDVKGTGATSAMMLPRDSAANRPTGVAGMIRYNTDTNQIETFNGTIWTSPVSSASPTFTSSINLSASNNVAYVSSDASNALPLAANAGINMNNSVGLDGAGSFVKFGSNNTAATSQKALIGAISQSSGNTPALVFGQQTGASTYAERMRLDPSGRLAIGTTTLRDSHTALALVGPGSWTHLETNASRGAGDAVAFALTAFNNNTNIANVVARTGTNVTSGALAFETTTSGTTTEKMRILEDGKVGIGTTAPVDTLDVNGNIQLPNGKGISTRSSGGTITNLINMATYNDIGIGGTGNNTITFGNNGNYGIRMSSTGMNIAGTVGIGTTSPAYKLEVVGDINATGNVRAAGTVLTSDRRFKQDIQPLDDALSKLLRLRGVSYFWRRDEFPDRHFNDRKQLGVIAQEVEREFPEVVDQDKKGFKAVNYSALVAPLIEAVKSLFEKNSNLEARTKAENQALRARTDRLEKENAELKARMDRLERRLSSQP